MLNISQIAAAKHAGTGVMFLQILHHIIDQQGQSNFILQPEKTQPKKTPQ